MEKLNQIVSAVDSFVWGPVMLVLLVGTRYLSDDTDAVPAVEESRICDQEHT